MATSFTVLGIITARKGSKRLPKKNVKLLESIPLVVYTFNVAKKSSYITDLIVSTDDEEVAKLAKHHGVDVPFTRPSELALDETPHLPVLQHALMFMEKKNNIKYDAVLILQPTSPFREIEDIDETIKKLKENSGASSAVAICQIEEGFHKKLKRLEGDRVLPYSDHDSVVYKRSGAAYVIRRKTLMEDNSLYGDVIVGHIVPSERSIDIDNEVDWIKAEYIAKRL